MKRAKAEAKSYKLAVSGGLFLLVKPAKDTDAKGRLVALKYWRMKYRFGGIEKTFSFGTYPQTTLSDAREKRDEARKPLARGVDPGAAKQAEKTSGKMAARNSFEAVAREWIAGKNPATALPSADLWSASYAKKMIASMENDVFPWMGSRPIGEITAPELLATVKRTASRGVLEAAHRLLYNCGQVFRYAVAHGLAERDPSADLRGALPSYKRQHYAAITDPKKTAELLRAIDAFSGTFIVQCALRLSPLLFARPGELRTWEWSQIDFEKAEWRYIASKTTTDHIVPLSNQAVAILRELQPLIGAGRYVFPGARTADRPMSDAAVRAALLRMGFPENEMSAHGFRGNGAHPAGRRVARRSANYRTPTCPQSPGLAGRRLQPHQVSGRPAHHDADLGGLSRQTESRETLARLVRLPDSGASVKGTLSRSE